MTRQNYKITIRSGSHSFIISPDAQAHLISHDGFFAPDLDVKLSSYASSHGFYPTKQSYRVRLLSLTAEIIGETDEARRRLTKMLTPERECTITTEFDGVCRKISVIPYGEVRFTPHYFTSALEFELTFAAPGIFFEDAETKSPAYDKDTSSVSSNNIGDVPCGLVVTIKANGGNVTTPGIKYGSQYVRCPTTLKNGSTLVIDTRERNKKITIGGTKYYGFDSGSTFFSLPTGNSKVTVTANSGLEYVDASVSFTPLYLGI